MSEDNVLDLENCMQR